MLAEIMPASIFLILIHDDRHRHAASGASLLAPSKSAISPWLDRNSVQRDERRLVCETANTLEILFVGLRNIKAELYGLANVFLELMHRFPLCMTAGQRGYRRDVVSILVALYHYFELRPFHGRNIARCPIPNQYPLTEPSPQ